MMEQAIEEPKKCDIPKCKYPIDGNFINYKNINGILVRQQVCSRCYSRVRRMRGLNR